MTVSQQEIQQAIAELQSIQIARKTPPRSLDRDRDRAPRPRTIPTATTTVTAPVQTPRPSSAAAKVNHNPPPQPPAPTRKPIEWWQPPPQQLQEEDLEQRLNLSFQALEKQAEQINQLAQAQETAILEFKAIADKVESNWKAIDLEEASQAGIDPRQLTDPPIICEYIDAMVPQVARDPSGTLVLRPKMVDIYKAEREAQTVAKSLRQRSPHAKTWQHRLQDWLFPSSSSTLPSATPKAMTNMTAAYPSTRRPAMRRISLLKQSLLFLIGGIVGRVVLDFIVALVPALWMPALMLMVLPGAIAMYQATKTPQSGFIWGYRLVLILMGLLIGGRL
jgi:hypothetical protein